MSTETKTRTPRAPKLWEALVSFAVLIVIMTVALGFLGIEDPHIPMLIGVAFAACMSLFIGYDWKFLEKAMIDGISSCMQACLILMVVGSLIGVWLVSGVVPSMIYYGMHILHPSFFLIAALLICSITSLATGTSWGTAGTIGVALIGVATGLGIPLPMAAGAVVSGAYFGDKMSPLSDTTNLAPGVSGTDLFTHVKFMWRSTIPTYIICLVVFGILGLRASGSTDMGNVAEFTQGLQDTFNINPALLIPPVIVIVLIAKKMPAIPGIFIGVLVGAIFGFIFQGNNLGDILESSMYGFESETGIEALDSLLSRGGLYGMLWTIALILLANAFGGIMEKSGQLGVLVNALLSFVKGATSLVATTIATCFISNVLIPDQYLAIIVPGRMYAAEYKRRGLHPKMLSNSLEASGTLTSALVPWNTCAVMMAGFTGVAAIHYIPYAMFNWLMPIVVIAMTAMGRLTVKIEDDPDTVVEAE